VVLEVRELVLLRVGRPGALGKASLESRGGGGGGLLVLAGEPRDLLPEDVALVLVALLRVCLRRIPANAVPAVAVRADEPIDGRLPIERVYAGQGPLADAGLCPWTPSVFSSQTSDTLVSERDREPTGCVTTGAGSTLIVMRAGGASASARRSGGGDSRSGAAPRSKLKVAASCRCCGPAVTAHSNVEKCVAMLMPTPVTWAETACNARRKGDSSVDAAASTAFDGSAASRTAASWRCWRA
jgi:hypothetical protein